MKNRHSKLVAIMAIALVLLTVGASIRWGASQAPRIMMFFIGIGIISITIADWRTGMVSFKGGDNRPILRSRNPGCFWMLLTIDFAVGIGLSGYIVYKWLDLSAR